MIALKNDYAAYTRTTDAKILLLREIIEKVKAGEKVDVERLLGTGDEAKEREWEEGSLLSLCSAVRDLIADCVCIYSSPGN